MSNLEYRPAFSLAVLAEAYRKAGKINEATILIDELKERFAENDFDTGYSLAFLAASGNDFDKAQKYLEAGFQNRDWVMFLINNEPYFEPMRKDPRLQDLLLVNTVFGRHLYLRRSMGPGNIYSMNRSIKACMISAGK